MTEVSQNGIFHRHILNSQEAEGMLCLAAYTWPDGAATRFRAFFAAGTPLDRFDTSPPVMGGTMIEGVRSVMRGLEFSGLAAMTQGPDVLSLRMKEGVLDLSPATPRHDLFAGMDVGLTIANGYSPEAVADWITYHARHHGMQGALVVHRLWPDENPDAMARGLRNAAADNGLQRLVLLEVHAPLGRADLPAETHPIIAPDAPGKDRMEVPPSDPFRAPLGEALIYEIAKWGYLAEASAVMTLEPMDILPVPATTNVFQCARDAPDGVVLLAGRRIFPWRVRQRDRPGYGDHICRRFDNHNVARKWCIAPERAGIENVWRMIRIAGIQPEVDDALGFWRCMGIRYPDNTVSEIAPKTSLVEDPALLAMADMLGHKPVRQPKAMVTVDEPQAVDAGYTAIVTCMKNEGPFILEWLAYHRAIGVEGFLVYTNDCTDGTDEFLDLLQAKGIVQHRDNPFRDSGLKPQHAALQAAEKEPVIEKAGWIISMDVDEFLNVHAGDGTLRALYQAVGDANMISATWRLFGNSDIDRFDPDLTVSQFTMCAPEFIRKPHQAWGFKTLFRNIGIYKKLGVHRPKGLRPEYWTQINWVNGSGQRMPKEMLRNAWRSTSETYGYGLVTLNHYAVRSAESFLVKRDRGRVNHVDRDQGMNYWFRMNHNADEDRSIQRMIAAAKTEMTRLLSDPDIAAMQEKCVSAHRAKIGELMTVPENRAFYEELCGVRAKKLSRLHHHFGANVFLAGPQVIPDEIVEAELPSNFFFTVPRHG